VTRGALGLGATIEVGPVGSGGASGCFSALPAGVSVRWRAARTLCSICERRAEYIERLSTDFRRSTKKIATRPITAANGPTRKATGIGADYRRSVHM
jgi:hypothetical protein